MERSIAQFVRRNSVLPVGLVVESGACHLVPAAATASSSTEFRACLPKLISSFRVCQTPRLTSSTTNVWQENRIRRRVCFVQAQAKKGSGDKRSSRHDPLFAGGGGGMLSDCPVPWEQQPVNEYQSLVEMGLFSWATDDDVWAYIGRLTAVGIAVSLLVAWPVVALSINPQQELVKCCVGALSGGVLASTMISLRLYLGWAYIGNRLFSATVEYEETGWYDGQVWVKSPEVLARDRLLGSFKVKPTLTRLKLTLVGLGISLTACTAILWAIHGPERNNDTFLIAQEQEQEESISGTARLAYSEVSARRFEPNAFAGEEDSNSLTSPPLYDYCQQTSSF
ncbi:unnamed protein product [Sphagnum troendelagicum]|uniref:DUF1230 family protein n=1 Tax=Sphagnum troendelagicum TaxID=128251 RepID=A0ABP0TCM2_9BRYO